MTVSEMVRKLGAGEFDNISDEELEWWDEFVPPMVSAKQFGRLYNHAKALLICHKLSLAGLGDSSLGDIGKVKNSFTASSVSDGGSSISFAGSGAGNLALNAEYGMTVYGAQFLQIMKMCIVPARISGEDDLNGRI